MRESHTEPDLRCILPIANKLLNFHLEMSHMFCVLVASLSQGFVYLLRGFANALVLPDIVARIAIDF